MIVVNRLDNATDIFITFGSFMWTIGLGVYFFVGHTLGVVSFTSAVIFPQAMKNPITVYFQDLLGWPYYVYKLIKGRK